MTKLFAKAYYEPQDNIEVNELSKIVHLMLRLNYGPRIDTDPAVVFLDVNSYNKFIREYNENVLRHFRIEIYGNTKRVTYDE